MPLENSDLPEPLTRTDQNETASGVVDTGASHLTEHLNRGVQGDQAAMEKAMALVYRKLRRMAGSQMANQPSGHSLQPTELANEALIRLVSGDIAELRNRKHFYNLAGKMMRQILIDHARKKLTLKRNGIKLVLNEDLHYSDERAMELVRLDDCLKSLEKLNQRQAQVVELKFFVDLTDKQIAKALGVSSMTVRRDYGRALEWLSEALKR
jgi:RNA polymerase sigma factor (TIGR02999 family)